MRSRLVALLVMGCAAGRPVSEPRPPPAAPLRFGVDTHVHLTMAQGARPLFTGEPGSGVLTWNPRARLLNQLEATHLDAAGVKLVFGALWPPNATRPGRTALDESLDQVEALFEFARRRPRFRVVLSSDEARTAVAAGFIAVVPQLEGGEGITRVEDVDLLYAAGVRCLTLVHFVDTHLGGSAKGQLEKNVLGVRPVGGNPRGLSPLGREVVQRAMDVGLLLDLSHASEVMAEEVLAMTEARGVPVINTHTGARALMDMERNLSSPLAARVSRGGGVIGVSLYDTQVEVLTGDVLPSHQHGTCDDVVAHWLELAKAATPERVVLGSDLNSFISRARAGGQCANGLRNASDLPGLFAALEANGVPRATLDGMGDAVLELLGAVEARADPAAQARARGRRREALERAPAHFSVTW
ncbi:MAG: membrane dipeptidase [Myxococcaceae bacterium]|nr:membrane dipeptidase [Myxococcaceae bacterium]MCA3013976.1 membrane dipeptidase [Myxococcaceae bacterium]